MKRFTATLEKFNSPLWSYHVKVPYDIAQVFLEGENRRVICTLNNSESFQCALMPDGDSTWFININKSLRNKLDLSINNEILINLEKDTSTYGLPMTEELGEMLNQDVAGNELFHALTPGKQRNLIYWTGQVKSPDKRMIRALTVIEHLKSHNGKIDFKALNQELKINNTIKQ